MDSKHLLLLVDRRYTQITVRKKCSLVGAAPSKCSHFNLTLLGAMEDPYLPIQEKQPFFLSRGSTSLVGKFITKVMQEHFLSLWINTCIVQNDVYCAWVESLNDLQRNMMVSNFFHFCYNFFLSGWDNLMATTKIINHFCHIFKRFLSIMSFTSFFQTFLSLVFLMSGLFLFIPRSMILVLGFPQLF